LSGSTTAAVAVLRQNPHDVLEEIELLIRGADDELLTLVGLTLGLDGPVASEHLVALLAAERWIGQHIVPFPAGIGGEGVGTHDRAFIIADAMQIEVHGRETDDARHDVVTGECVAPELGGNALVNRARIPFHVLVGIQQEAAGPAGGVAHGLAGLRVYDGHNGIDQ
jgi:hypothetical protein